MKKMFRVLLSLLMIAVMLMTTCAIALAEEPTTIRIMSTSHVTAPISTDMLTMQVLAQKFNVKLEFELVPEGDYTEKINAVLAGGDLPDLFYAPTTVMGQYYEYGIVRQLDELLEKKGQNFLAAVEKIGVERNILSDDGHYYYVPYLDESAILECCGWMNVDMMEECGIESLPTTYDELISVLETFKAHYGADSGYIPMSNGPWYTVQQPIYYAYNTWNSWVSVNDEDGYVFGPYAYQERTKAAVSLMNKLYTEGLLDSEFITRDADAINALAAEGKIGYFVTWADHASAIAEGGSYGCRYVPVPALETDLGTKGVGCKGATGQPMYISATCSDEKAELIMEMLDYIYSEEGMLLFDFGVEGDTYEMVDGKPQLTEKVLGHELGELNGRRSFGMEPQGFPHYATWEGWKSVLWDETIEVTEANEPYVAPQQPNLTGTVEEETELAQIMGDITAYTDTTLAEFIVGTRDIDTEWDAFIAQLEAMNIKRASEIQAAKFQRWLNR